MKNFIIILSMTFCTIGLHAQSNKNNFILKFAANNVNVAFTQFEEEQRINSILKQYTTGQDEFKGSAYIKKKKNGKLLYHYSVTVADHKGTFKDVLSNKTIKRFKNKNDYESSEVSRFSSNGKYLAYVQSNIKIISWGKPFSFDESYLFFTKGANIANAYFGKQVIEEYITKSDTELDSLGLEKCKAIKSALSIYKKTEKDESEMWAGQGDVEELYERINKRSFASYYMTISELLAKGDNTLLSERSKGAKTPALANMFYKRAAELEPNKPIHPCKIGIAYLIHNMFQEALDYFNKALAIKPNYPLALWGIVKVAQYNFNQKGKNATKQIALSLVRQCDIFLKSDNSKYVTEISEVIQMKQYAELFIASSKAYFLILDLDVKTKENKVVELEKAYNNLESNVKKHVKIYIAKEVASLNKSLADKLMDSNLDPHSKPYHANAAKYYNIIKTLGGADAEVYYYWIIVLQDLGIKENAIKVAKEAITKFPDEPNLLKLKLGIGYDNAIDKIYAGNYSGTKETIIDYVENYKKPINDSYMIAGIVCYHKKDYKTAVKYFDKYVPYVGTTLLPEMFPNYKELHEFAKNSGNNPPKIKNQAKVIEENNNTINQMIPLVNGEKAAEVIPVIEDVIKVYKPLQAKRALAIAYNLLGAAYYKTEQDEKAINNYKKSIESEPAWSKSPYTNVISALKYLNKHEDAKIYQNKAKKAFPDF